MQINTDSRANRNRMSTVLFVYGTLRRGLRLHHHMDGAEYLSEGRVKGDLYDIGAYPGLVVDPNSNWVTGELFAVDELILARLDKVEGYDQHLQAFSEYIRKDVTVLKPNNQELKALTYIYNHSVQGLVKIASGNYNAYLGKPP